MTEHVAGVVDVNATGNLDTAVATSGTRVVKLALAGFPKLMSCGAFAPAAGAVMPVTGVTSPKEDPSQYVFPA
jgi:hypothetical protein